MPTFLFLHYSRIIICLGVSVHSENYSDFNKIETDVFYSLTHTDHTLQPSPNYDETYTFISLCLSQTYRHRRIHRLQFSKPMSRKMNGNEDSAHRQKHWSMHSADIILMATFFHPILPTFWFSQQQTHPHQRVRSDPFLSQLRHSHVLTRQRAAVPRSAMTQQGWRDTAPRLLPPSDSPLAAGWKSRRGAGREGKESGGPAGRGPSKWG